MVNFRRYCIRNLFFISILIAGIITFFPQLKSFFMTNPTLNGVIVGTFIVGFLFIVRQFLLIYKENQWLQDYQKGISQDNFDINHLTFRPRFLSPLIAILEKGKSKLNISPIVTSSLLDAISLRLSENRDISKYFVGLLVFLGLLGTFWGLLYTINSIGDVIQALGAQDGNNTSTFKEIIIAIQAPLKGMGTAFSSSLFGLAASLVLGFFDLQINQVQNQFYNSVEDWLSQMTSMRGSTQHFSADKPAPAYIGALLEQTAENIEKLEHATSRLEQDRISLDAELRELTHKINKLTDHMSNEKRLLSKLAESQVELKPVISNLVEFLHQNEGLNSQNLKNHHDNVETLLASLLKEMGEGREKAIDHLRGDIKLLARTIATTSHQNDAVGS